MKKKFVILLIGIFLIANVYALCANPFELFCIFGSSEDPVETPQTGAIFEITSTENLQLNKDKGLEKWLVEDKTWFIDEEDIHINLTINMTVYNWMKDTYQNPTLAKCYQAEPYIQEDFPNFDCTNSNHRIIALERFNKFVTEGFKIITNGIDMGYVNRTGNEIFITIPKNYIEKNQIIELGESSIAYTYQNISMVNFVDGNLSINNTLRKWNGESFVVSPDDIWIKEANKNNFKFGANDTNVTEDTRYQYEWSSNKEIKYDDGYYYFDEEYIGDSAVSHIYSRNILDLDDICDYIELGIVNDTYIEYFNPSCSYQLTDNNTKLLVNFTGYYNTNLNMIFIDPIYHYLNVSTEATSVENVRSEPSYSHLEINNNNLVLYMPFDTNTSGTTYDYSNNDNDGTIIGATWNSSAKFAGGFDFTQDTHSINVGNDSSLLLNSAYTISIWGNQHSVIEDAGLVSKYVALPEQRGYEIRTEATNEISAWLSSDGESGGTEKEISNNDCGFTSNGEWTLITVVYNSSHVVYYKNGQHCDIDATGVSSLYNNVNDVRIGECSFFSFNGTLDEVMIFNNSLSAEEVATIYNATYQKFYNEGNQNFTSTNLSNGYTKLNVTINVESLNDSYFSGKVWESTDNSTFTESSSGELNFTTLNVTHERATFVISSSSEYFFPEIIYSSENGFYSGVLQDVEIENYDIETGDTTPPTYSNIVVNSTIAGQSTNFSIQWNDGTSLNPNGQYIFSTNNSGVWVNDSAVNFTSTPSAANIIKTLNATEGLSIGYRWYATDNATNSNDTGILTLTTTSADSCTYTSGDWIVDCSDNCVISSPVDVDGNDIYITGTGTFLTSVDISNYNLLHIEGTDSSNICRVTCNGGCFI